MKFTSKIFIGILTSGILSISSVFAAGIDHFNVTMIPDQISAGESVDLTIEAADKNDVIVKDYTGTILIFSESDADAELPSALDQNTYVFMASDQWVVKFENAVTFSQEWLQNIYIYDLDDETIIGLWEVNVSKQTVIEEKTIEILSPENGLTIWDSMIKISWKTQKNHKIIIVLNEDEEAVFETISNSNGDFEQEITNLKNWENSIVAHVLDADENRVWESNKINIKVESIAPTFKSVKTKPQEVESEWMYTVEVIASKELTDVSIVIDDVIHVLSETSEWIYSSEIYAPVEAETYKIDVILKDELWLETKELWAGSITVNEKVIVVPVKEEEPKIDLDAGWIEPIVVKEKDYSIKNLKVTELKSKSVLTWDAVEDVESYEIYKQIENGKPEIITTVTKPRFELEVTWEEIKYDFFAVKAVVKTASWETIPEVPMSEMTKVQTGPEMIILLLLSLLIGGAFFMKKQKA
jgi:hypothetical protein